MQKRFWAILIKKTLLTFVVLFVLGFLFDRFTNEPEYRSPFLAGAVVIACYIVISVSWQIFHALVDWLYLSLFAGDDLSSTVLDDLRRMKIPPPSIYESKNHRYLAELADSPFADANDRVAAAVLHGGYKSEMARGLFRSLMLQKAIDDAVLRYSQEAPQRSEQPNQEGY